MASDTEARLLWATTDDDAAKLVQNVAADLGLAANTCTPRDIFEMVRPSR